MAPSNAQKGLELLIQQPFPFAWAEYISQAGATSQFQFGADSTQASMTIETYWRDFENSALNTSVIPNILGFSRRSDVSTQLDRTPPVAHPIFTWLYATGISGVTGIKPLGKVARSDGYYTQYQRARMTINFTTLPYEVYNNASASFGGDESKRWVSKVPRTTEEYISIDSGEFQFAEGAANNPNGISFPLGTGRINVKTDLEWTWFDVPNNYIFDANGVSTNINASLGTVNSASIWGYPAGTLLMLSPEITPVMQPVNPLLLGLPEGSPPRSWNVKLRFKYWNPEIGPSATTRGHNTAMYLTDGFFYLIKSKTRDGGVGQPLFKSSNFQTIFQGV